MEETTQRQFHREAGNWLSRGRTELLGRLTGSYLPPEPGSHRLLEIGAGFGENVPTLARFGAVDVVEVADHLAEALGEVPEVHELHRDPIPDLTLDGTYDVIVAWDVLEHIERDDLAVDWIHDHLVPGGAFVAAVPAYQWLFSDHDRAIHHYRRYTRERLARLIGRRLHIDHLSYFNTVLFPAAVASRGLWQLRRNLAGSSRTPEKHSSATNGRLDRLFGDILQREAEHIGGGGEAPFGLSVVCTARRPDGARAVPSS